MGGVIIVAVVVVFTLFTMRLATKPVHRGDHLCMTWGPQNDLGILKVFRFCGRFLTGLPQRTMTRRNDRIGLSLSGYRPTSDVESSIHSTSRMSFLFATL